MDESKVRLIELKVLSETKTKYMTTNLVKLGAGTIEYLEDNI